MTLGKKKKCQEGLIVCINYEFILLHHVGVVAKKVCAAAAETVHEGDDNTPSGPMGRGVKINTGCSLLSVSPDPGSSLFSICYSLSDGGGWSKMKVSFSVSSRLILKGLSQNFVTIIISSFGNNPENFA